MERNQSSNNYLSITITLVTLVSTIVLSSCYFENITSDYRSLPPEAKERVVETTTPISSLKDSKAIYLVTAQQVKDFCKQHSKVIIYNFSPFKQIYNNLHENDFVDMCKEEGVEPLVVSNSFLGLHRVRKLGVPLLMINYELYKTNKWRRYTKLFYQEVTNSHKHINNSERFFVFKNGIFIGNFSSCNEALSRFK